MTFVYTVFGAIVGAALGAMAAGALFYIVSGAMGLSDFEGQRAMIAAFAAGPVGALVGGAVGIWAVLRLRKRSAGQRNT